jgi:DNA polymerase III subunit epsilon
MRLAVYLFFDTETTGLPRDYKAPVTDLRNWPRLVQLGWVYADESGEELACSENIVKPEGFVIPESASSVHHITTSVASAQGVPLRIVLDGVTPPIESASSLIAHNIAFDEKVLGAEFLRTGLVNVLPSKRRLCTMESGTNFCQIPGINGYKWPKLEELHVALFGAGFEGAHDALADVRACARCFFELKRRGIMG